jgi:hypothetical protein
VLHSCKGIPLKECLYTFQSDDAQAGGGRRGDKWKLHSKTSLPLGISWVESV